MPRKKKLPEGLWERNGVYYARFRAQGKEVRKRLSADFDAAREMLNDLRARADKSDFGLIDNAYPWADLKSEFMKWAKQSIRDWENYEEDLAKFDEFAKVRTVSQVTFDLIHEFRDWRLADGVGPRTVNRQVGTIHNMLNKAVEWKRIGSNPIKGIKPLPNDTPRKERRALSLDEVLAIFEASEDYLKPVWRTFLCSGIRHDELVQMKFADVDFDRKVVTIRASTAKSHKPREIPLDDVSLDTIRDLLAKAKDRKPGKGNTKAITARIQEKFSREHVFVNTVGTPLDNHLLKKFYAVCKRAGIEGAHPCGSVDIHALRGAFATLSMDNGANPKAIQAILGHSTLAMTMNLYSKATESGKRAAVGALPFAKVTTPAHLIPVPKAHTMRTSKVKAAQGVEAKAVADVA